MRSLVKLKDPEEKRRKQKELSEVNKSLKKMRKEKKGEHIELIKRMTADGDDLVSPDKVNSQNVLDMIIAEQNMKDNSDSE